MSPARSVAGAPSTAALLLGTCWLMVAASPDPPISDPRSELAAGQAPKPHLLFVALSLDVGGAERHLSTLLPELVRRGWPVTIFCTNRLGAFAGAVRAAGVDVIGPPRERRPGVQSVASRLYSTSLAGARLFTHVRRLRPAVAHFFLPEAYLIGAPTALLLRVPVCVMSRRGLNYYQAHWPGAAAIEKQLHPRMTAVLANSRRVAEDLRAEGCEAARIGLIYNGVALKPLAPGVDRFQIRHALGLPHQALVAIVVANLIHYKGHADLLRGLASVRGRLPANFHLLCIGRDEGARTGLEALRAELGLGELVTFMGVRNDVPELLAASDMSILPSHEEGFSNAVIEAMAAGLPMVVTDVGGNGEAVAHDVSGLVVPPKQPSQLGEAVARLAESETMRLQFGEAGRLRVRERFTLTACVDNYERLYEGLIAGRSIADIGLAAEG